MSSIMSVVAEFRADVRAGRALSALIVGVVIGVIEITFDVSVGVLIFSGPLAPFLPQGIGMVVFGAFAVCLVIALTGGYRGAVSGPAAPAMMVLASIGAAIALEGDALFMTMVAILIISAATAGVCMLLIGRFRLANLIRFVPYPVAGGVLAGAGGFYVLAAFSMMGVALDRQVLPSLLELSVLWNWGPGVAYGLGLFLITKRWSNFLILPASFVLVASLYHVSLPLLDFSRDEAGAAGLLFADTVEGGLWPVFRLGDLKHVDWAAVAVQIPGMLALVLVTLLAAVINLSGCELAVSRDLDWNREFRAAGRASVIAGLGGGPAGNLICPPSILAHKLGADTRLTGVVVALVAGSVLLWGDVVLALVPVPLAAGILLFIGAGMLDEWLVASRKRLPWADYAILLLIFVTIISLGVPEGVGVGMAITTVFFAVRLARVDSVESEFTARERQSNRSRPIADRAILLAEGERVRGYRLRGYIFFGSAYALAARLRQSLSNDAPPACILLDFGAVSGLDFSAINSLCQFVRASHDAGVRVVLSAAPDNCKHGLERNLPPLVYADLLFEPDADRAMERCEDLVIAARRSDLRREEGSGDLVLDRFAGDMESYLDRRIRFEDMAHELREWLEVRDYAPGEALVAIGAPQDGLQLLLTGRAAVYDTEGARLRQCGTGDVLEVRGAFEAYAAAAAAVAEEPCRTLVLTPEIRRRLEERQGPLMLELYGYLLTAEAHSTSLRGPDAG